MGNCKPIAATPALSGEDAKRIIAEALREPSKESIERLERRLEKLNKAMNC